MEKNVIRQYHTSLNRTIIDLDTKEKGPDPRKFSPGLKKIDLTPKS
jgi:hypothetical protein